MKHYDKEASGVGPELANGCLVFTIRLVAVAFMVYLVFLLWQ